MFDLRNEDDVARDIEKLNNMCKGYQNYRRMMSACVKKFNIKEIIECKHDILKENYNSILNCPKCSGTGYIIVLKEEEKHEC